MVSKLLIFILLFCAVPMFGQVRGQSATYGTGAPSGGLCTSSTPDLVYIDTTYGTIYFCNSSAAWVTGINASLVLNGTATNTFLGSGTASNTDLVGELALTGTTASYSFQRSTAYTSHPECTGAPQADPGSGVRWFITYTGVASFTVNFTSSYTGNFSYICNARN